MPEIKDYLYAQLTNEQINELTAWLTFLKENKEPFIYGAVKAEITLITGSMAAPDKAQIRLEEHV